MGTVLNWKGSLGNVTLSTTVGILVPFQDGLPPLSIPAATVAQTDEYGIYFLVKSIDATTGEVTFKTDVYGFKIPYGYTIYKTTNTASLPGTTDDYLNAIGYPPGAISSGIYTNALELTTIRMGDGNDVFTLSGNGITQSLRAVVDKEASQGYIFQSNIFAGAGNDYVGALMPFQSVFKGGTNTTYFDAVFAPGSSGTGVTLSDNLTLEEVQFGDTIVLKGSRFDWDIEFKDANRDGHVTLTSILDETDYLATSNNNQISGFERIRFGDILFDLVLARQQDSSAVYGQPDYYLIGSEPQAPELNSNIESGSQLWEAFRFNRTKLQGITGTATNSTDVFTGNANDTPFLVGALQFASLNTEAGNDIVEIGSADQASVDLGTGKIDPITGTTSGGDLSTALNQLKVNGSVTRSSIDGGAGKDNIIVNSIGNSTVKGGAGDDVIQVITSTSQTQFDGGGGSGDVLLLPGTFASYGLTSSNSGGTTTFNDGFGNILVGFESIKFSDINLAPLQQLTLAQTPAASTVPEGETATYAIALSGSGLQSGQSVAFSLQLVDGTAQFLSDLSGINASSLLASAGIVLSNIIIDATAGVIKAVATTTKAFSANATIATLALPIKEDFLVEGNEAFGIALETFVQKKSEATAAIVTTTINDGPPVSITLTGTAVVTEGQSASYTVALNGVGLAAGRSVTFTVDNASGTATEGTDFSTLLESNLVPSTGISLSGKITDPTTKAVTVTATNISGAALAVGAPLLTFLLPITVDSIVEGSETFSVTLASSTAVVGAGLVTTTIKDLVGGGGTSAKPVIKLTAASPTLAGLVTEGQSASYAVSLDGVVLTVGDSVTFTLDTASGTATKGVDFASLAAGGLTAANGVTLTAVSTDPNSKAVTVTATNTGSSDLTASAQLLSFVVTTLTDSIVENSETFTVSLSSTTAKVSAPALVTMVIINAPAYYPQDPGAFTALKQIGSVALGSNLLGYALKVGSGNPIQITYAGINASPTSPGAGWSAIAGAANGAGFDLYLKNTDGSYAIWNLNGTGVFTGGKLLSTAEFYAAESSLSNDLNGDGSVGNPFSAFKTVGSVALGSNAKGYALQLGGANPIQITYAGINASATSPGGGWSAIAGAANGTGFDLYLKNTDGSYAIWNLNGSGMLTGSKLLSTAEFYAAESSLSNDLNTDGSVGFPFSAFKTLGSVALGSNANGYALQVGSANPIQITYAGINASATSPGGGWSAIAGAANGTGFDLYLKNTDGSYAIWNLNGSGMLTGSKLLSTAEFYAAESSLSNDLNTDGSVGFPFSAFKTLGSVALGSNANGYALQVGSANPIQITYAGINASATSPGGGWSAIAGAANGTGFDLYLKNTDGSYAIWNLNGTGVLTGGKLLSTAELLSAEVSIPADLSGEGQIGPFALQGGTAQADSLTGLSNRVTFGFGGSDTLTGGSTSANGFDILIGGAGNDSYVLPSGRSTLIADLGGDAADSFTSTGLSLNGPNTKFGTLEGGRHLVISDSGTNTRAYLYDWQTNGNKIESFQLNDGLFSFLQLQQKVTSLGASVTDSTWASWDTQFGNNQLTNAGFASGTSVDKLLNYYKTVDASGVIA